MPQYLSVFRAARLAGVSRGTLQKRIRDGELPTFEGRLSLDDLLRLYPDAPLGRDREYERVERIKATAYAKRVRERILPEPEVLVRRLNEVGAELGEARQHLSHYRDLLAQILVRLQAGEPGVDVGHWLGTTLQTTPAEQPGQQLLARDTVLRIMEAHVTLRPTGHEYWQAGNDSLLEAGLRAGLALNYGCANGNCGLCKARLVKGEVKQIRPHDYTFSAAEKNHHYILLCAHTAVSDVELEALEARGETDIPLQQVTTKVKRIDTPLTDILQLHLQTPRTQRLRFLAGQTVTLTLPDGESREQPIASCPCDDRNLLFHIQRRDDAFSARLFERTEKGAAIVVSGPRGHFLLNEDSHRAQIFLAYGTGFAPINSLIEHSLALDIAPHISLYWATETPQRLYASNLCRAWEDALEDFRYRPLIDQDPLPVLARDHPRLAECDVYLAGPSARLRPVREGLLAAGLPPAQLMASEVV